MLVSIQDSVADREPRRIGSCSGTASLMTLRFDSSFRVFSVISSTITTRRPPTSARERHSGGSGALSLGDDSARGPARTTVLIAADPMFREARCRPSSTLNAQNRDQNGICPPMLFPTSRLPLVTGSGAMLMGPDTRAGHWTDEMRPPRWIAHRSRDAAGLADRVGGTAGHDAGLRADPASHRAKLALDHPPMCRPARPPLWETRGE